MPYAFGANLADPALQGPAADLYAVSGQLPLHIDGGVVRIVAQHLLDNLPVLQDLGSANIALLFLLLRNRHGRRCFQFLRQPQRGSLPLEQLTLTNAAYHALHVALQDLGYLLTAVRALQRLHNTSNFGSENHFESLLYTSSFTIPMMVIRILDGRFMHLAGKSFCTDFDDSLDRSFMASKLQLAGLRRHYR